MLTIGQYEYQCMNAYHRSTITITINYFIEILIKENSFYQLMRVRVLLIRLQHEMKNKLTLGVNMFK